VIASAFTARGSQDTDAGLVRLQAAPNDLLVQIARALAGCQVRHVVRGLEVEHHRHVSGHQGQVDERES